MGKSALNWYANAFDTNPVIKDLRFLFANADINRKNAIMLSHWILYQRKVW